MSLLRKTAVLFAVAMVAMTLATGGALADGEVDDNDTNSNAIDQASTQSSLAEQAGQVNSQSAVDAHVDDDLEQEIDDSEIEAENEFEADADSDQDQDNLDQDVDDNDVNVAFDDINVDLDI
jgi:hypothetical protein